MIAGGATDIHQRGSRRPDGPPSFGSRSFESDPDKVHARTRRPSMSIFQTGSTVTFAAIGAVLLLILIGAVIMISDTRGDQYRVDERTPLVPGPKAKKIVEEALKKKISDESAEEYAQRVRERYLNRIAKLREEEMKKLAEDAAKNEQLEPEAAQEPPTEQVHQAQQAQPPQPQAVPAEPVPQAQPPHNSLEESLRAIHEQLARLQAGFLQKQVEQQTSPSPPPSLSAQEVQRQSELQELARKMNELRAQSAALEAMIEEAKNKQ